MIASSDNRDLTIQSFMENPLTEATPTNTHLLRTAHYPGQTPGGHVLLCHDRSEIGDHMFVCVLCGGFTGNEESSKTRMAHNREFGACCSRQEVRRSLGPVLGELDWISVGKKQKEKSGREDKEKSQHVAKADRSQLDFYWAPSIFDRF